METYFKISVISLFSVFIINLIFWVFMFIFYGNTPCDQIPTLCDITDIGIFIILICMVNIIIFAGIFYIKEEVL